MMLEIGSGPSGPVYIDVKRDGYPLLLVSPRKLQQLYQALGRYPMNNAQRLLPLILLSLNNPFLAA